MNNKMKHIIYLLSTICLAIFYSCNSNDINDEAPAPMQVSNPTYEKTRGGAIISYSLPEDKNLLFVKAQYTNSQGKDVFKVSSRYNNQIEIDGFNDLNEHVISLYSVGTNGRESKATLITIIADTSYIHSVQNSLSIEATLGGVQVKWSNPTDKVVYVYLNYSDGTNEYQKIIASKENEVNKAIKGLEAIPYHFTAMAEDVDNNRTGFADKGLFTPKPEMKINKALWELVKDKSCNGDEYEGKMVNFWDDVIDTNTNSSDNSYFLIHRNKNGGSLLFLSDKETKPLMIVIDMKKSIIMSRLVIWQRAYNYHEDDGGANQEYAYYSNDNLRSFHVFGANNLSEITPQNVWANPLMICDIGDPRDEEGNVPTAKIQEAKDGHEFMLPELSTPFRYLVLGLTATYGSETQICSSEITIYGLEE